MGERVDQFEFEAEADLAVDLEVLLAMAESLEAEVDGLEAVGADLAVRCSQDPDAGEALARALSRDPRPGAALLLQATRFFAHGAAAERIDAVLGEEEEAVDHPPALPGSFGDLSVPRALRCRTPPVDNYLVLVERVGYEEEPRLANLTVLTLDQGPSGGPLVGAELSPPLDRDGTEDEVRRLIAESEHEFEEIDGPLLGGALLEATAENRRQDWPVDLGAGVAVSIIAVALGGDPGTLGEVPVREPDLVPDPDDLDDVEFRECVLARLDEFMGWLERTGTGGEPVLQYGHMIAGSMLEWKWTKGDASLSHWTGADLGEFLLDYVPRQVTTNDDLELAAPDCVAAYLTFLDEGGELAGDTLSALTDACRDLHEDFLDAAADTSRWCLTKAMAMRMLAEGIDPTDPDQVGPWIKDFNDRTFGERDAVVGPSIDARG